VSIVREGAFEIKSFRSARQVFSASTLAQNRTGTLRSRINADGVVRVGQDRENEVVPHTRIFFCDAGLNLQTVLSTETSPFEPVWTEDDAAFQTVPGWSAHCRCNVADHHLPSFSVMNIDERAISHQL
jgi:hypothetical protein